MATDSRFLKVDGAFQRPIPWNALSITQPTPASGAFGMPALTPAPSSRFLDVGTTQQAGGGSPLPSNQPTQSSPAPAQSSSSPAPAADPMGAFNTLMLTLLKSAQGVNTADLLKRKRELEREASARAAAPTEEKLRTLSPAQQDAIRSGNVNALAPEFDENAYELEKAQQAIDNFFKVSGEAQKISQDFADKMVAPDSVIQNAKRIIEADPDKMSTILAGFNDKSKQKIIESLNYGSIGYQAGIKNGTVSPGGGSGTPGVLSPLAQAVQNGTIKIESLPSKQRAQVAAELAQAQAPSSIQNQLTTDLQVVDSLLAENTDAITGVGQNPFNAVGLANTKALNLYKQLQGILKLENRQQLKGQGAISDFEFSVLADAASSLGRNLNNKDFRETLQKIRDVFAGKYKGTTFGSGASNKPQYYDLPQGGRVYLQPDGTYK